MSVTLQMNATQMLSVPIQLALIPVNVKMVIEEMGNRVKVGLQKN